MTQHACEFCSPPCSTLALVNGTRAYFKCAVSAVGFREEERSNSAVCASTFPLPGERNCKKFHLNNELYYEAFSGHTFHLECTLAGKVSGFSSKCSRSYL